MNINESSVRDNIDFVLAHFKGQHELFPRTIMTAKSRGQIKIKYETDIRLSKENILDYFKQANYVDCKINAFPFNTEHTRVDFDVKNKTAADFIMIDLDLKDFNSKEQLDRQLKRTLNKISLKFHKNAHPTVLWTGNGYHIYQPIDGMVFERHKVFYDFLPYLDKDLSTEFLRFAEKFFTNGKADPNHMPSIKSCLTRVPGTINSKNNEIVKIIQKWDGKKPAIQLINEDFRIYLIQKRIDKIKEEGKKGKKSSYYIHNNISNSQRIGWIENLLKTPIDDYRKFCLWRIVIPYLVNIRKLSKEESTKISGEWLQKCDNLRRLDFNHYSYIQSDMKRVKEYLPFSKEKLKQEQTKLFHTFRSKNILSD